MYIAYEEQLIQRYKYYVVKIDLNIVVWNKVKMYSMRLDIYYFTT